MSNGGKLIVVGSGIQLGQMTIESAAHIQRADAVFYTVTDAVTENWIKRHSKYSESLRTLYIEGQSRLITYNNMVDKIMDSVRKGNNTCAVFYGHPGIFVNPGHRVVQIAREEGFLARMLPGISAEDCLYADLGIDPGYGCQSFEATDFVVRRRVFDPLTILILWQIGSVGEDSYNPTYDNAGLLLLRDYLLASYPKDHEVIVYEAPELVIFEPKRLTIELGNLEKAEVTGISTLFVPTFGEPKVDWEVKKRLDSLLKT